MHFRTIITSNGYRNWIPELEILWKNTSGPVGLAACGIEARRDGPAGCGRAREERACNRYSPFSRTRKPSCIEPSSPTHLSHSGLEYRRDHCGGLISMHSFRRCIYLAHPSVPTIQTKSLYHSLLSRALVHIHSYIYTHT